MPTPEHRSSDPGVDVLGRNFKDQESVLDPFTLESSNESLAPATSGMPTFIQNQRPATPDHTLVPTKPNDYSTQRDKPLATPPDSALKRRSGSGGAMYRDGESGRFGLQAMTADQRKLQQLANYLPFFENSICDKVCKPGCDKTDTDIQLLQAKAKRVSAEFEGLRLEKERNGWSRNLGKHRSILIQSIASGTLLVRIRITDLRVEKLSKQSTEISRKRLSSTTEIGRSSVIIFLTEPTAST